MKTIQYKSLRNYFSCPPVLQASRVYRELLPYCAHGGVVKGVNISSGPVAHLGVVQHDDSVDNMS